MKRYQKMFPGIAPGTNSSLTSSFPTYLIGSAIYAVALVGLGRPAPGRVFALVGKRTGGHAAAM